MKSVSLNPFNREKAIEKVATMAHSLRLRELFFQFVLVIFALLGVSLCTSTSDPELTLDYYACTCPKALEIVRREMECAVLSDPRNAALILRLHFHDCFVQGCDWSVLLDDTITLQGEKTAAPNVNSLKGFELIDIIKSKLESECPLTVSCADILTIAARDAVILVGGPYWDVPLGRKDSRTASYELATCVNYLKWTGKYSFNRKSLHALGSIPNPY